MTRRKTKTTPTKVERLTTALYKTHYQALHYKMWTIVGGQADDLISELAEKLVRHAERWDGDDSRIFSYLYAALYRLALNRVRDQRHLAHEVDRHPDAPVVWDIWTDRRDNPEALAVADDLHEKWRAAAPYADLFDHMVDGGAVFEFCNGRGINRNTAHAWLRKTRGMINDINE